MHDIKPITPVMPVPNAQATHIPPQTPVQKNDNTFLFLTIGILLMAFLGTFAGWGIYTFSSKTPVTASEKKSADATPIAQTETPTDAPDAEGTLEVETSYGQGVTHKIGDVYLLSSLLDLDAFVGKDVKIWGSKITTEDTDKTVIDIGRIKEL